MKASEAPEKIILSADKDSGILSDYWVVNDYTDNTKIEYTRTDAFIDKAATWFANRYQANGSYLCANDIDDFVKYMKGE